MEFIVDGQRIATENFLVGQIYEILYKNENKVYAMCQGIGSDFVMFIANNPRVITLNLETAQTIDEIMPAEAASMYDYDDLINKPSINSVELIGNLSSSDLGLQSTLTTTQMTAVNSGIDSTKVEQIATNTTAIGNKQDVIDSSHKLSADLVDDSSSTQKFATAAQLEQIATNTTAIAGKQNTIDSSHKLSADLVDDSSSTQKFATAAQLAQIGTNETNISTEQGKTTAMSAGGSNYIVVNNVRIYVGATEPTGTIPEGSLWLNSAVINP